ncbi:MAG: hypothetical protein JWP58_3930 [Hymenobacter sp.]|nr:hypothetical protein [Hymenobacter sp.]
MGPIFKRINWPLLFIHFLAIPCFILGGQLLERIRWVPLRQAYQTGGLEGFRQASGTTDLAGTLSAIQLGPLYAWLAAVLLGCSLSALVMWRRREGVAVPLLLFGLAVVTSRTHYYKSKAVLQGLSSLLDVFAHSSRQTQLGIVGSAFVLLGLLPFLLTWAPPQALLMGQQNK